MLERCYIPVAGEMDGVETYLGGLADFGLSTVDSITRYAISNGGKRIRPAIFFLSAKACAFDAATVVEVGAAIEMIHASSLLHDDVIDDSPMRRGNKSVRMRWGNQASVLIGDLLWSKALKILIDIGNDELVSTANESIGKIIRGELLESAYSNNIEIDTNICMDIIRGKTAELFSMAAKSGAIVAGVEGELRSGLADYGFYLGQAFQLVDDVMDYAADEASLGKSKGQDLREGNLTYPLVIALGRADSTQRKKIKDALISNRVSAEQLADISKVIRELGGIDETLSLASDLCMKSKEALGVFRPSMERDSLVGIADYVINRS